MQSDEFMSDRRRALEDSFFAKKNAELLERLKRNLDSTDRKKALAAASGITDDAVLEHLLQANIQAETVAALGVVPLLAVAWADGKLDEREKQAVLTACETEGLQPGSEAYHLLDGWLKEPPTPELLAAWKDFIAAARTKLSPEALTALKDDVLGRARKIATTSGGILGISTISGDEQRVLGELENAFAR